MRCSVYCSGSLLAAVQEARLFPDCKHFVDMPMKHGSQTTLDKWNALLEQGVVDEQKLRSFISEHFEEPGEELETDHPGDFMAQDAVFETIKDIEYRAWAMQLHNIWPTLSRKVRATVLANPDRFSLIALPHSFIVPGGRFREMYYWDSFFTLKGLLASRMFVTARGMILNMKFLIDEFGFVPNGNRVYYLNRSQPPLLTWCVDVYWRATGDTQLVKEILPTLRKELAFFNDNRCVNVAGCEEPLYRYKVDSEGPRPESYREDTDCAEHIIDLIGKRRLWGDIAAAAESGRDFSSRWFHRQGPHAGLMASTRTSEILPVDLNAIICANYRMLAELYGAVGDEEMKEWAREKHERMRNAINKVFWNDTLGCWFDVDLNSGLHLPDYFDTNLFPLIAGCTHDGDQALRAVAYLETVGALACPGGLPSSLITSGQQWDFPNAWAPTTWVVVQGLREAGQEKAAMDIAAKWIARNFLAWRLNGTMFEKYNVASACLRQGGAGGGGEYAVQEGFGWTNGVMLDLLLLYGQSLSAPLATILCQCCAAQKGNCPPQA